MNTGIVLQRRQGRVSSTKLGHGIIALLLTAGVWTMANPNSVSGAIADDNGDRAALLVTTEQLASPGVNARLVILDVRPKSDYEAGHIPRARWVDLAAWQALAKREGGLTDADAWRDAISKLGVNPDSQIVVYGARLPDVGRAWWTLKYVGLEYVAILDGGWSLWTQEGRATSTEYPRIAATRFEPRFDADRLAELGDVKTCLADRKTTILDTRTTGEFTGQEVKGKRGGHVPGATHLDWQELVDLKGRFKSPEALAKLFADKGITVEDETITYCHGGGRASVEAFALELAGFPKAKVYLRSWEEWSADESAPIE